MKSDIFREVINILEFIFSFLFYFFLMSNLTCNLSKFDKQTPFAYNTHMMRESKKKCMFKKNPRIKAGICTSKNKYQRKK
jgi:hypothetical protein